MRKFVVVVLLAALAMSVAACGVTNDKKAAKRAANAVRTQDVLDINKQVLRLRQQEPLPQFNDSAALHVQNAWYTADADRSKKWYVTIVGMNGAVLEHFDTIGAPQPAGDQVSNPVQQICAGGSSGEKNCDVIGLPEPNGVHQGTSNDGYVAILTTGAMKRFSCAAVYCDISDQPLSVRSAPALTINESASISATSSASAPGGVIPKGTSAREHG